MNNAKALIDGDILIYKIGFSSNEPDEEKFAISRMGNFVDRLIKVEGIDSYEGYLTGKKKTIDQKLLLSKLTRGIVKRLENQSITILCVSIS